MWLIEIRMRAYKKNEKKIKVFNLTYLLLMSNIQDRNNITNCYI